MAVIGLDPSLSCTGLARIHQDMRVYTWTVKSKGKRTDTLVDRVTRIDRLVREITEDLNADSDTLAVIESPSYGSAGSGTWDRAGLWHGVVAWLWKHDIPVAMVAPTTLKRWITGSGRADKEAVQAAIADLFPDLKAKTNDECDAASLAHCGAFYKGFVDLPHDPVRHNASTMAAVKWPSSLED